MKKLAHETSGCLGGSLGWKAKGSLDPKFEEVAFALEPSSTSRPKIAEVKTGFGYHIIMVYLASFHRGLSPFQSVLLTLSIPRTGRRP